MQVLPVDPGPEVVHHPLLDLLLDPLVRLGLQLQRLVVVLPLFANIYVLKKKKKVKWNSHKVNTLLECVKAWWRETHSLEVEEVLFEGFSGLRLLALVDYIWVFFVATALVVLAAVGLPVAETHPAEILPRKKNTLLKTGVKIYRDNSILWKPTQKSKNLHPQRILLAPPTGRVRVTSALCDITSGLIAPVTETLINNLRQPHRHFLHGPA